MRFPDFAETDARKAAWTDKLVKLTAAAPPELSARFVGKVGRVVTVNYSGRAVVDFADGAWYDVTDFTTVLEEVTDPADRAKYDPAANAAQKMPPRQG